MTMPRMLLVCLMGVGACELPTDVVAETAAPTPTSCRVARIVDGDTFTCRTGLFGTELVTVRLLAVDAPERDQPVLGPAASAWLAARLPIGARVALTFDRDNTDRYGRLLAWVEDAGGQAINLGMVREGMGVALIIAPNTRYAMVIRAAEAEAFALQRGLWAIGLAQCRPSASRSGLC